MHLLALLLCLTAVALAHADQTVTSRPVDVYVDGELVHYYSQLLDSHITAGRVVNGTPMVAVRFLTGACRRLRRPTCSSAGASSSSTTTPSEWGATW
jgi:hypothetical protein